MKKRIRQMVSSLLTLVMILTMSGGFTVFAADGAESADTGTVTLKIHRKAFQNTITAQDEIQNTGKEISEFDSKVGVSGVTYLVFDITDDYYKKAEGKTSASELADVSAQYLNINLVKADTSGADTYSGYKVDPSGTALPESAELKASGVTSDNTSGTLGDLTIENLPKLHDNKNAVYLIIEATKAGYNKAANMVVGLPVMDGDSELPVINLYPKETAESGTLYVSKTSFADSIKGSTNNGKLMINDAQFNIQRVLDNTYISGASDGVYTYSADKPYTFTSGKNYTPGSSAQTGDDGISAAASDAAGVLEVNNLYPHVYRLIETKSVDGTAAMVSDQTIKYFFVTGNKAYQLNSSDADKMQELEQDCTLTNAEKLFGTAFDQKDDTITNAKQLTVQNDTTEVTKELVSETADSSATPSYTAGSDIKYKVTANVPMGIDDVVDGSARYDHFNIEDVYSAGLSLASASDITVTMVSGDGDAAKSTKFTLDTMAEDQIAKDGFTVAQGTVLKHAALSDGTAAGGNFVLKFNPADLTPGATIQVEYTMHITAGADGKKITAENGYENAANVDNGLTWDQTPPSVTLKTGAKNFIKTDMDTNAALQGAKFIVTDTDAAKVLTVKTSDAETSYKWVDLPKDFKVSEAAAAIKDVAVDAGYTVFTVTSEANGTFSVAGLAAGEYSLVELQAPENYRLLTKPFDFTVTLGDKDTKDVPNTNINKKILPLTGGIGILVFILAGGALIGGSLYYFKKRRNDA